MFSIFFLQSYPCPFSFELVLICRLLSLQNCSRRSGPSSTGVRSCYDEGKRTAETLAMDYHRGAGVEVRTKDRKFQFEMNNCPEFCPFELFNFMGLDCR